MRIGFLIGRLRGDVPAVSILEQAAALAARGHEVAVTSVYAPEQDPGAVPVAALADAPPPDPAAAGVATGAEQPSVLVPPEVQPGFVRSIDRPLRAHLVRAGLDVLVTPDVGLMAAAARLLPEETALVYQEYRPSGADADLGPLLASGPRIDLVTTPLPSTGRWLREELAPAGPTVAALPHTLSALDRQRFRPRSALDSPLIAITGSSVRGNAFRRLASALGQIAEQIPDWRLRVLGEVPARPDLDRPIRKFALYDRVEVVEQVRDADTEWARASIAVHVSRGPDLPLLAAGALAAGVPAIGYDFPSGARDFIEDERNGLLVAPGSTPGIAAALLRLARDEELRRRLGEGALRTFARLAAEADPARWESLLEKAVAHRRTPEAGRRTAGRPAAAPPVDTARMEQTTLTPQAARTLALGWAVRAAEASSSAWFVIPSDTLRDPVVAVPAEAREKFLAAVSAPGAPAEIALVDPGDHGWPERRGPIPAFAEELAGARTPRVRLEPWPRPDGAASLLSQGCAIDVEFWQRSPAGELIAPRPNRFVRSVPTDAELVPASVEGVTVRTLPLMVRATVHDCTFPIDVVYTWVDGLDPVWNEARLRRLADIAGTAATRESSGRARFVSRDELRYSLRSVHLFAPWVRRIHLVTAGQTPPWLVDHPQIRVVDHAEILPAAALPTFNSHAIEAALHRVPDLAEHWIYFNDDIFLGRPLRQQAFFSPAGQPMLFPEYVAIGDEDTAEVATAKPWVKAAWNNRRLLDASVGRINVLPMRHTPHAHRTSVIADLERRFPEEFERTRHSPFRADTDISVLSSLAQHYGLATGQALVGVAEDAFVDISSAQVVRGLRQLLRRETDFFCLGDHHDHALTPGRLREVLGGFFTDYFPVPAPWEAGSTP